MSEAARPHHARVAAVVVSFNRRPLLEKVITAVRSQTLAPAAIVVVDNGSTDGSREYLESLGDAVRVILAGDNLGGAGGFATGMAWALALDVDFLWLMDDDAVPYDDALEALAEAMLTAPAAPFATPMVMDDEGRLGPRNRPRFTAPAADHFAAALDGHAAVTTSSFVGPLIRVDAAARTHLPLDDYFIWHDDTEYTARLAKQVSGRAVPTAKIAHLVSNPGPDTFVPNRAFYNIRNLAWSAREAAGSALSAKDWRKITAATIVRQFRAAGPLRFFAVLAVTVRALAAACRRRPAHHSAQDMRAISIERDQVAERLIAETKGAGASAAGK